MVPKGLYHVKEDEEREIEDEETPAKLTLDHCWKIDNWVHYTTSVLKQGRVVREEPEFVEEFEDEEEQQRVKKTLAEKDLYMPRLAPIVADERYLKRSLTGSLLERRANWKQEQVD